MSKAAETIQAAIDKLETLKKEAWSEGALYVHEGDLNVFLDDPDEDPENSLHLFTVHSDSRYSNGEADEETVALGLLIVTLHRTIDAQLDFLREALAWAQHGNDGTLGINLARAILGEEI